MKNGLKQVRHFSEPVRKQIVQDIEKGKSSVLAASRELGVSEQTVYRWLNKYSRHLQSSKRMIVETKSEAYKSKELEKRIQELEAALGRKQLEIDFLNKMIEIGKEELGVDLKKKFSTPPFNGSGITKGSPDKR
jgi:transposase-like protein